LAEGCWCGARWAPYPLAVTFRSLPPVSRGWLVVRLWLWSLLVLAGVGLGVRLLSVSPLGTPAAGSVAATAVTARDGPPVTAVAGDVGGARLVSEQLSTATGRHFRAVVPGSETPMWLGSSSTVGVAASACLALVGDGHGREQRRVRGGVGCRAPPHRSGVF
jgi:hypothetical protein